MSTVQTDAQKDSVLAMIAAHGLEPRDVASIDFDPRRIRFTRYLRDEHDRFYFVNRDGPPEVRVMASEVVEFIPYPEDDE